MTTPLSLRSTYHLSWMWPVIVGLFSVHVSGVGAQPRGFEEDYDDEFKPWVEVEARMPARPDAATLEPLYVSAATSYRFMIDRNSISNDRDGVIRYTLVSVSDQGARNISYEGIRCATRERKLYAFGRPDGTWSRSRRNAWDPIREADRNRQHAALYAIFCDSRAPVGDVPKLIERLKNPPPLTP